MDKTLLLMQIDYDLRKSKATLHRLQSNDDNWHQIRKEDGEGRELPYCEIVNTHKETVAEVFRAVNTFDQARKALRAIIHAAGSRDGVGAKEIYQAREALAAMEGQP